MSVADHTPSAGAHHLTGGLRVAVVIPAYREARLLPRTLSGIPPWVEHVVVVDDGSPDDTAQVAEAYAADDPRVDVVRLGQNQGVGRAIVTGYARAVELGAEALVVMAADDQMDPDDLPAVLAPLVSGQADYVKGERLSHPEAHRMPPVRRVGTRVLARLTGWASGLDGLDDTQCGYTALRRETFEALAPVHERLFPRYGYPNDLLIRLAEIDARVAQVTVRPVYADEVSGLRVHRVIVPISGILLRGAARRLRRRALGR